MKQAKQLLPLILGVIVLVAGGALYSIYQEKMPALNEPRQSAGFGKLPALTLTAGLPSPAERSAVPPGTLGVGAVGSTAMGADAMRVMPCIEPMEVQKETYPEILMGIPAPCPTPKPVEVHYEWKGETIPSAASQVLVLKGSDSSASASSLSFLAGPLSKLFTSASISSFSARDTDGYSWTLDSDSRSFNFWLSQPIYMLQKDSSVQSGEGTTSSMSMPSMPNRPNPTSSLTKEESFGIARAFFEKRGIPFDQLGAAVVTDDGYGTTTVSIPYYVNNYPVIGWGGRQTNLISVYIDANQKVVSGGTGIIDGPYDSSPYPSITSDEAIKKILAGGMNPYNGSYWWYSTTRPLELPTPTEDNEKPLPLPKLPETVTVSWKNAELAYFFMNSYEKNHSTVYLVPVYLFKGAVVGDTTIDKPQEWTSWVPAVSQEYFEDVQGGSGMGGVEAVPPMEAMPQMKIDY